VLAAMQGNASARFDGEDQRGFIRPNVKKGEKQNCDSGSFELKAKQP
jgi:hypothetical protein